MRHIKSITIIAGKVCTTHLEPNARFTLLQPVDSHDLEELQHQIAYLETNTSVHFNHIAIHIDKWNAELTPWESDPIFGKIPFGKGAHETFTYIKDSLLKNLQYLPSPGIPDTIFFLGGYSLAGLFALWSAYQSPCPLEGIAACSPSVWFKDWLSYASSHSPHTNYAYLSLGDKEHHTKTKIMSTVNSDIQEQYELFRKGEILTELEWNHGNHFQDNGIRMGKGFLWLMNQYK